MKKNPIATNYFRDNKNNNVIICNAPNAGVYESENIKLIAGKLYNFFPAATEPNARTIFDYWTTSIDSTPIYTRWLSITVPDENFTVTAHYKSAINNQYKNITPNASGQTVTFDNGYSGLASVYVGAVPTDAAPTFTSNGTYTADQFYKTVNVNVTPDATALSVTENGTYTRGADKFYNTITVNVTPVLQSKTVTPIGSQQIVTPDAGKYGLSSVTVNAVPTDAAPTFTSNGTYTAQQFYKTVNVNVGGAPVLVSKTVKSTGTQQTILPDEGYDGFNQITVNPIILQSKSVKSTGTQQTILPDEGYDGFNQITVNPIILQSKSVTPIGSQQIVTPDAGKDGLSSVTVNAVPTDAAPTITANGTYTAQDFYKSVIVNVSSSGGVFVTTATIAGTTQTIVNSNAFLAANYNNNNLSCAVFCKYGSSTEMITYTTIGYFTSVGNGGTASALDIDGWLETYSTVTLNNANSPIIIGANGSVSINEDKFNTTYPLYAGADYMFIFYIAS